MQLTACCTAAVVACLGLGVSTGSVPITFVMLFGFLSIIRKVAGEHMG